MSVFVKGTMLYPPRIVCFVCACEGPADYPLYAAPHPHHPIGNHPHFPFLLAHPPPMGCQPVEVEARACRPCYTTLMRQWDEFETARVPVTKRAYWVKRVDGVPFLSSEAQRQTAAQIHARLQPAQHEVVSRMMVPPPLPPVITVPDVIKSSASGPVLPLAHEGSISLVRQTTPATTSRTVTTTASSVEEISQVGGISGGQGDNDSALDLSSGSRERETMKSRSSETSHATVVSHDSRSYQSEGAGSSTDILDLTLPDKNAAYEVCYVCGDEFKRGTLSFSFAKQMNKEPFYPSLTSHSRPARSRPMDFSGRVQTCDECHNHLLQQWYQFEAEHVLHADRNYTLRKRAMPSVDNATFVCYICALDYHSSSLRLLYSRPNTEEEPYYPFIEQQKPPPGASPVSPQGMVQVCTLCYKATEDKRHGFMKADQPPPKKRRIDPPPELQAHQDDEEKTMPADITCILCRRKFSVGTFKFLHIKGPPMGGLPFFPFLKELPRPEELWESDDDRQGRIRACQACTTSLMNQWTAYQRENVPIEGRLYTYPSLVTGPRSLSSVRAQSPASQRSGGTVTPNYSKPDPPTSTPALALVTPRTRSNTVESRPLSVPNPQSPTPTKVNIPQVSAPATVQGLPPTCHSPAFSVHSATSTEQSHQPPTASTGVPTTTTSGVTTATPATTTTSSTKGTSHSSFYCFLCGLHSELSFSRMLYSSPQGKKAPYFPFMRSHVPKNKAETLREDGTALVCTFCYHSVMVQWAKHNDAKPTLEPSQRKYNVQYYVCYVCGITTYRKRIRALRVHDFPFLRHHKPRKGVIMLENGEMVAVCLDCYDSLRGQYNDGERYGIPVDQRQYNWMKVPPPPEEAVAAGHITTPQERLLTVEQKSSTTPAQNSAPQATAS